MLEPRQVILLGKPSDKGGGFLTLLPKTCQFGLAQTRIRGVDTPFPFHQMVNGSDPSRLSHYLHRAVGRLSGFQHHALRVPPARCRYRSQIGG